MARKRKSTGNGSGSGPRGRKREPTIHDHVRELMAAGAVEDEVAAHLRMDKNRLRRKHIFALKRGREIRQQEEAAAAAAEMTRTEMCCADAVLNAFADGDWLDPDDGRSLLFFGLDGDGAKSASDAFAQWIRDGERFDTTGVSKSFSAERVAELQQLKAAAQALLGVTHSQTEHKEPTENGEEGV